MSYDAARTGRRMAEWRAPTIGPRRVLEGLQTIRNRSRDAGRNEWAAASAARVLTSSLIGTGIVARPRTTDKTSKLALIDLWNAWCKVCDADSILDFYGLQALATLSFVQTGEVFLRFRARRMEDGLPVPMQVQVIESDMIPMLDEDMRAGLPRGNRIRQGIELNPIGRRVAYWIYRDHPGDATGSMPELVRVPVQQVAHVYRPSRPGQLRGVPDSASIMTKLRTVMHYDDNVLTRQQMANMFAVFFTRPVADGGIDPLTGKNIEYGTDGSPIASLEPGLSQELMPGEDVRFSNPPDAGSNYADFMRNQHMYIASGQGIPYELLTGDIRDVSDRTLRVVINEFRRHCEQVQWTVIIPMLCERTRTEWANAALLAGVINDSLHYEALRTDWAPQAWARIHPTQDVQAEQMEVEAGFRSRASVIASRGYDAESVDEERAADMARESALGLTSGEDNGNIDDEPE